MRYGILIGIIVGAIGCGEVELAISPDAGDGAAGSAGTTGSAGANGGSTGSAGTGGSPACVADACNDCIGGVLTPKMNGTSCGEPSCTGSATSPFGGQYPTTANNYACRSGTCVKEQVNCPAQTCGCTNVGYIGCFMEGGPAECRCVTSGGAFCDKPLN